MQLYKTVRFPNTQAVYHAYVPKSGENRRETTRM